MVQRDFVEPARRWAVKRCKVQKTIQQIKVRFTSGEPQEVLPSV